MQNDENRGFRKTLYLFISIVVAVSIWLFVDQISGPNGGPHTFQQLQPFILIAHEYFTFTLQQKMVRFSQFPEHIVLLV